MRMRFQILSWRDALAILLPLALVVGAGFWAAAQFIKPAPPKEIVMTTGGVSGAYTMFAARYKPILARYGIELVERPSDGAVDNLRRLMDPNERVDVGFVQGGLGMGTDAEGLVSLGSFYFEPLWVFYRSREDLDDLNALRGKRIAVGGEGSGTRKLSLDLLEAHEMTGAPTAISPLGGLEAVAALADGRIDAAMLVGPVNSGAVWTALHTPGVKLMTMSRADAYVRRHPYLTKLTLPRGTVDLVRNIPAMETTLVAPTATLVAREDFHPALIDLLLKAATEVHGPPGIFHRAGEFPNPRQVDFPLSREAERFYNSGTRFLQRYLPFWAATLVDRLIVMLIPLFALLIPAMKVIPALYAWRVRSRIYKWYGELKFLEREIAEDQSSATETAWLDRLERLEQRVNRVKTPNAYTHELYILREHINLVRRSVQRHADQRRAQPLDPDTPPAAPA
jgi:TRAP transporter TAXI family solute receptor